jgi:hypothetical protein
MTIIVDLKNFETRTFLADTVKKEKSTQTVNVIVNCQEAELSVTFS